MNEKEQRDVQFAFDKVQAALGGGLSGWDLIEIHMALKEALLEHKECQALGAHYLQDPTLDAELILTEYFGVPNVQVGGVG